MLEVDLSEQDMEFDAFGGNVEERVLDFDIPSPDPANQVITTAVCAICKNENPYILEWVAYQKLSGFDQVFVYDNDSDDGTSEALIRLHNAGEITRIYWPRIADVAPQRSAYADFLERFSGNYDWALICDLDEFLCIDVGNVKDFIAVATQRCPEVSAIAIPWLVFGASGQDDIYDELVVKRFTHCEKSCDGAVKPLFKPSQVFNIRTHVVDFSQGVYLDNTLRPAVWNNIAPTHLDMPKNGIARIHHYFTKSRKEWEKRKSLGRADRSDIQLRNLALFDRYEHLDGRNQQLVKHEAALKEFEFSHKSALGNSVSAQLVFRSDSSAIVLLGGDFENNKTIRVVLNDRHELLMPNILSMTGGKCGVSISLTHLREPLVSLRISDISTGRFVLIGEQDFPSRKRMLRNVLSLMPDAEMLKFNMFRRVSSTSDGCEYLKQVEFGNFSKFLEYRDLISLLKENGFSKISEDQINCYLERHGRMGQATLQAFKRGNHHVGTLIPDFERTDYIVY